MLNLGAWRLFLRKKCCYSFFVKIILRISSFDNKLIKDPPVCQKNFIFVCSTLVFCAITIFEYLLLSNISLCVTNCKIISCTHFIKRGRANYCNKYKCKILTTILQPDAPKIWLFISWNIFIMLYLKYFECIGFYKWKFGSFSLNHPWHTHTQF